jgi:hypothetical protein
MIFLLRIQTDSKHKQAPKINTKKFLFEADIDETFSHTNKSQASFFDLDPAESISATKSMTLVKLSDLPVKQHEAKKSRISNFDSDMTITCHLNALVNRKSLLS